MPPLFPTGKKWVDVLGTKKTYTGTIPPLSLVSLIDLQRAIWKIEAMAKTVPKDRSSSSSTSMIDRAKNRLLSVVVHRPFDCPKAAEWDSMTVETWKRQNLWTDGARTLCDIGVR